MISTLKWWEISEALRMVVMKKLEVQIVKHPDIIGFGCAQDKVINNTIAD